MHRRQLETVTNVYYLFYSLSVMVRYKVIQPSSIRFTTDKIASHFDNGLDLNTVIDSIGEGSTKPESIGGIRVFNLKGIYHTCDNKRLYILRSAQSLGYLDYISVSVVSPCEIDLNVVKSGRHGKWITFDDDHEPYVHWIEEWGFPRVVNRQISSSGSVRSQGSRKSSSEKVHLTGLLKQTCDEWPFRKQIVFP